MRTYTFAVALTFVALSAVPASAQAVPPPESAHVELGAMWWQPDPLVTIASGNLSSDIDFVQDLGVVKDRFRELRVTLKPGRKHKLRFAYVPVRYTQEGQILRRSLTFRGVTYNVNLPVNSDLKWDFYRVGYEWDLVSARHGFLGIVADVKYNKLTARLTSPIGDELTTQNVPVPTIGGIARVYLGDYVSATGEFTGFSFDRNDTHGQFYDLDVYGQVNVNKALAAQVGYRSVKVDYSVDADQGNLKLDGFYFGGVVRF